ncbi:MAG: 5-formyltetrahydrofolate cyclo-ligase [Clostridiales bacterium]|nr:5-formyltetrahydrofolate cyclo-ligase [Clostridiales bacterium]
MPLEDIRPIKSELRNRYKALRRNMDSAFKESCDETIAQRVSGLWQYAKNRRLFTYVSTAIEVDTRRIIEKALEDGKTVAVPRCVPGTRDMEFYLIRGLDELEPGTFGVLEPRPDPARLVKDFSSGLGLIPALCYDWHGYRLGYGKGYYDRFLANFGGHMVGICYSECVRRKLPHGRFDRPAELLVTERYLRRTGDRRG